LLYSVSVAGLPFTYPPFAAVLFVPLQLLGEWGARWVLTAVSLGCYLTVVLVCARRLRMSLVAAGGIGLAGLTLEPFLRTILLGQVNFVLLALIVVDALVVPAKYRGWLIGIATGIKILPGAFIFLLILRREWGAVARTVAGFAATVAVGAAFAPGDSWQFWSGGFINLSRFGNQAIIGGDNQSLSAAFMRLTHDLTPPTALLLLMSVAVLALSVFAAKRQVDSGNDVNALVCIGFGSLLASPVSWTHHWIWVVVALLVLVQGRRPVVAAALGTIFVIAPMWLAPRGHLVELSQSWWQAAACVSYVVAGLSYLTYFAAGRRTPTQSADLFGSIGQTDDAGVTRTG
jgi:alpha-1,2-mannosyltransferase